MKIGLKYCGECNPCYDRSQVEKSLQSDFNDLIVEAAHETEEYDVIAVICGCHRRCTGHSLQSGRHGNVVLTQLSDYTKLHYLIKEHLMNN